MKVSPRRALVETTSGKMLIETTSEKMLVETAKDEMTNDEPLVERLSRCSFRGWEGE